MRCLIINNTFNLKNEFVKIAIMTNLVREFNATNQYNLYVLHHKYSIDILKAKGKIESERIKLGVLS